MTDHEPTTADIREAVSAYGRFAVQFSGVQFDRWLTGHDADVRADMLEKTTGLNFEGYPELVPFVARMLAELRANSHKGDQEGWRKMPLRQAWHEISWHAAKLAVAIKDDDETKMREYAADIANGAMMLNDILDQMLAESTERDGDLGRAMFPGIFDKLDALTIRTTTTEGATT